MPGDFSPEGSPSSPEGQGIGSGGQPSPLPARPSPSAGAPARSDGNPAVRTDVETADEGALATSLGLKMQEPGERAHSEGPSRVHREPSHASSPDRGAGSRTNAVPAGNAALEAEMAADLRPPAVSPWEQPPDARLPSAGSPSEQPPAELGQRLAHATHRWLQASAPDGRGVRVAQARFDAASGEFHLQLHPPELGALRVRVSSHDGALTVAVLADRPDTGWLLVRHSSALEHAFEQAGLRLGSFSVNVGGGPFGGHPQPGGDSLSRLPLPATFWDMPAPLAEGSGAVGQGGVAGGVWERGAVDLRV